MPPRIGYLLPTRERVMESRPEAASLLALAERAEALGYESIWVGDSILARPRHEPLTLLSAVAARTKRAELGTAVLLPALRNPVVLAHGIATLDQISEGRFILGVGIARMCRTSAPNSSPAACRSKSGSAACWKGCASAVNCGAASRSTGTAAGSWKTPCSARHRTVPADRRSGSAAWCARASNESDGSTTAGSPMRPTLANGAINGRRSIRLRVQPGATRRP